MAAAASRSRFSLVALRVVAVDTEGVIDSVRPLCDGDVSAVVLLREGVAAEGLWIGEADRADRDATTDRLKAGLANPRAGAHVAVLDNQVVGFVHASDEKGCAHLGMFVERNHRGRGVGRRLLTAAIAWAQAAGCHKIALEVWPHNHSAIRLYELPDS